MSDDHESDKVAVDHVRSGQRGRQVGERSRSSGPIGGDLLRELFQHPLDPGYAEAARRRAQRGVQSRRAVVFGRVSTVVVAVVFGFLVSVAYLHAVAEAPHAESARERLLSDIDERRDETEALERRAEELRDEVADLRDRALAGTGEGDVADELREWEAVTGLARVQGPGVVVTVSDAPDPTDPVTGEPAGQNLGRVFDRDLQDIVNGLWAAGAEAVAVGGQRLSAVSTIRAAGEAILVDFQPVFDPYVVEAIGPPEMQERFVASVTAEKFEVFVDEYGMGFSVDGVDELDLPSASEPGLRHATPGTSSQPAEPSGTGGD